MSRRDLTDTIGLTLLGVILIGLLYCAALAVREHIAAGEGLPW